MAGLGKVEGQLLFRFEELVQGCEGSHAVSDAFHREVAIVQGSWGIRLCLFWTANAGILIPRLSS